MGTVLIFATSLVSSGISDGVCVGVSAPSPILAFISSYSFSLRAFSARISSASLLELEGLLESSESDSGL